ncbi:MAG TPA: hypothetical protein VF970_01850 [Gemmatimonadales bacterium]
MGRLIGSVALGYVVMFVLVFCLFTALYLILGADRSFQPGTYDASWLWIGTSTLLALLAAAAGGWACAAVARNDKGPKVLAGLVIALGLLLAVPVITADPDTTPRTSVVGNMEAMQKAQQPVWIALLNPFLGAIGVMAGARLFGVRKPESAPAA